MRKAGCVIGCLLALMSVADGWAQPATSDVVYLTNWPAGLYVEAPLHARYPYDLLPAVDSLALRYAPSVEDGQPLLEFSLSWMPGAFGVFDNQKVDYDALPDDLRLAAVELLAEVVVDGQPAARLTIRLDSLSLAPLPEMYVFSPEDSARVVVSTDVPEDSTRTLFARGFTLRHLDVLRIAFASYEPIEGEAASYHPRYPTSIGVYPPDIGIWIDWVVWPDRSSSGKRGVAEGRPARQPREGIGRIAGQPAEQTRRRGDDVSEDDDGEGREGRTGRARPSDRDDDRKRTKRSGKKDDKDDDDDDDTKLLPAALVGVAAIGFVAFGGGTVGYYANLEETPIGLTSGFVFPKGGALIQVAVNEAVLGQGGEEKLIGKVAMFYDVFHVPVQPALGVGVLAEELGDDVELTPRFSLGAAGNFGPLVLLGSYDLAAGSVELSVAVNFRSRRGRR